MNCYILLLIVIILISLDYYHKNTLKFNIINYCKIPSYILSRSTNYRKIKEENSNNSVSQLKMNKLRNIKTNHTYINDYIRDFMEMPYDKYFKNIDFSKVKNIEN